MKIFLSTTLSFFLLFCGLHADKVRVIPTNQVYDNVKTTANGRLETIVEFKDGTKQILKTKDLNITSSPVIWEEAQNEKPSFWKKLFASKETSKTQEKSEEENKSFFERRFPELAIGTMALLFFLLP